jgi:hypothetical protein
MELPDLSPVGKKACSDRCSGTIKQVRAILLLTGWGLKTDTLTGDTMRKFVLSTLAAAFAAGSVLAVANTASADEWHHHHNNTGAAIAGGLAGGVIGGLLAGAVINDGPRYIDPPPPPPPRCWFENRPVQNAYDGGWHYEDIRVCR